MINRLFIAVYGLLLLAGPGARLQAQSFPTEKEYFGFNIGDDYHLATYTQTVRYFKALDAASDRAKLVSIGKTEEGREQYMMIVSSPENMQHLEEYRKISQQLAHAEDLTDDAAKALAEKGKAVVWIDGGMHANEVEGTHQLIKTITQLLKRNDPETKHILDNVIILLTHINPDGQELVSGWYMRMADTLKRALNVPRLWQKYIGHDNNRDFYMMNMKETQNISRQLFVDWIPQILYNHHQPNPPGTILAGPPYRDPFNFVYDPLLVTSIDGVAAAMNNRLNAENKPGYTQRAGSPYSTWWNGGLRTAPYFHNIIGLLTEIIGNPTPMEVPFVPGRLLPSGATPNPVMPQKWHFHQSMEYSLSLNYAVLDYAARMRSELLYNIYHMGKNAIEKGSRDNWTFYPKYIDSAMAAYVKDSSDKALKKYSAERLGYNMPVIPKMYYDKIFKNPAYRDARTYIIPAGQADFATATRFVNTLIRAGIKVMQSTAAFTAAGKSYPANSYIISTAQAFRPYVMDMFEPQDHPNDFQYPGGPPIKPYDATGWTLAYQMGVQFDRLTEPVTGPFKTIPYGEVQSFLPAPFPAAKAAGYALSPLQNNVFITVNDLLKAGITVSRLPSAQGSAVPAGAFYVNNTAAAAAILRKGANELGLTVTAIDKQPAALVTTRPVRLGIFNIYGGSIPAGWQQWLMEQYHFSSFRFVYPQEIDAGHLNQQFDVIVFADGSVPPPGKDKMPPPRFAQPAPAETPAEYKSWLGYFTVSKSVPMIQRFLEAGGKVITLGSGGNLAYHLHLPVEDYLVEKNSEGRVTHLSGNRFYVPGSLLVETLDTTLAANWGMPRQADVYYANSPVFKLSTGATEVKPLSWFATATPLHSGWAWGQAFLKDGVSSFEATVGKGTLVAFGPDITFRGQSHVNFKRLFNQLYLYK